MNFFIFLTCFAVSTFLSHFSTAQDYYRIIEEPGVAKSTKKCSHCTSTVVEETEEIVKETVLIDAKPLLPPPVNDPHVQIIGWDSRVPLKYLLSMIQEGVTDQLTLLKLFSAPNIITRSPQEKEMWIYHWLWSYNNTKDPDTTYILMKDQGLKLKHNKKPVSLSFTFNDKNIVESYSLKLLKVKHDRFYEH